MCPRVSPQVSEVRPAAGRSLGGTGEGGRLVFFSVLEIEIADARQLIATASGPKSNLNSGVCPGFSRVRPLLPVQVIYTVVVPLARCGGPLATTGKPHSPLSRAAAFAHGSLLSSDKRRRIVVG